MKTQRSSRAGFVPIPGSAKAAPAADMLDTLNPADTFDVTVRVRRSHPIEASLRSGKTVKRDEYGQKFGASDTDLEKLGEFADSNHLSVVLSDNARRSVILKGKVKDFEMAFDVHLSNYRDPKGIVFRGRSGNIHIPKELAGIVEGVFGLDNRPLARPMFQVAKQEGMFVAHASAPHSFTPNQLANIYGFPAKVDGKGQCIGIIELGGGYRVSDLKAYFKNLGLKTPSTKAVSVDGGLNNPSTPDSADGEVMLDIEVAGAVAPGSKIVVYFAPNTDKGFLDAITTAVHDSKNKPSVISISWGSPEINWTTQSLNSFNEAFKAAAVLGVSICAAAGDQGSSDSLKDGKVHADFPASSPSVLGCGGTKLITSANKIVSETVWNESPSSATGGGVSDFFALPQYQKGVNVPPSLNAGFKGRGLPDVAGNADPATGYQVLVDGQQLVIGGTSAVAPLMAALIALLNQQKGKPVGFIHPALYANPSLCRDITQGDNITTPNHKGYQAGTGWDACTGWGVLSKL